MCNHRYKPYLVRVLGLHRTSSSFRLASLVGLPRPSALPSSGASSCRGCQHSAAFFLFLSVKHHRRPRALTPSPGDAHLPVPLTVYTARLTSLDHRLDALPYSVSCCTFGGASIYPRSRVFPHLRRDPERGLRPLGSPALRRLSDSCDDVNRAEHTSDDYRDTH